MTLSDGLRHSPTPTQRERNRRAMLELVKNTWIEPTLMSPGQEVTIAIEFTGRDKDLKYVEIIPRQRDKYAPIQLTRDPKTKKNMWSATFTVPDDVKKGFYELELKVTDRFGDQVVNRKHKKQKFGKTGLIKFEII